jgi:hypothetical protein
MARLLSERVFQICIPPPSVICKALSERPERIWLVLQLGAVIGGAALEAAPPT